MAPTSPESTAGSRPRARASTAALESSPASGRVAGSSRDGSGRLSQPLVVSARLLVGVPGSDEAGAVGDPVAVDQVVHQRPGVVGRQRQADAGDHHVGRPRSVPAGNGTSTAMPASTAAAKSDSQRASSPSTTTSSPSSVGSPPGCAGGGVRPARSRPTWRVSATACPRHGRRPAARPDADQEQVGQRAGDRRSRRTGRAEGDVGEGRRLRRRWSAGAARGPTARGRGRAAPTSVDQASPSRAPGARRSSTPARRRPPPG